MLVVVLSLESFRRKYVREERELCSAWLVFFRRRTSFRVLAVCSCVTQVACLAG